MPLAFPGAELLLDPAAKLLTGLEITDDCVLNLLSCSVFQPCKFILPSIQQYNQPDSILISYAINSYNLS